MSNPLYQQFGPNQGPSFLQRLQQLKSQGGDPNAMIQEMLNSGRVSQAQYNQAVQKAQQIMQMFSPSVRR